jgi:hypothetical protein
MTRVSVNQGRPSFLWQRLLGSAGSRVARGKIKSDVRHQLDYSRGLETHALNEIAR